MTETRKWKHFQLRDQPLSAVPDAFDQCDQTQDSCTVTQVHVSASLCTSEPSPGCDEPDPRRQRPER